MDKHNVDGGDKMEKVDEVDIGDKVAYLAYLAHLAYFVIIAKEVKIVFTLHLWQCLLSSFVTPLPVG